ncbi:MAG: ImmA/IrrE family metallo-endopeptidase [Chloroflexi bacterium]|nr:ImmA/IrrE family metallo-endopeptidase [Chloroflexota bacterium]
MLDWLTRREEERRIVELVDRVRREHRLAEGCSAADVCACLGLEVTRGVLADDIDGLLSGRTIVVNERLAWPPRIEFTIFHEIVHHLLDDDGELIEYFTGVLRRDPAAYRAAIERCCNAGAAEFLLPERGVRDLIASDGLSVDLVERLAHRQGASIVAAGLQVACCAPVECYIVLVAEGPIPRVWPPRSGLYLEYAFAQPRVRYPLGRFSPVPHDHLLTAAWREQCPMTGPTYVPFRTGTRVPCLGEVKPLGRRVIGLLTLGRLVPREQLALPI